MAEKRIVPNLARYFREMKNDATSHDKVILLLSGGILLGSGVHTYRGQTMAIGWPITLVVGIGVMVGAGIWLVSFVLGVWRRAPVWRPAFPPYCLIRAATIPIFVIAMGVGFGVGTVFFGLPAWMAALASLVGQLAVVIAMHALLIAHTPLTRAAVQVTHDPNVMTVDAHRYMWLFPALGVLGLLLVGVWAAPESTDSLRPVAVTAAMATAAALAGFGAGYIP